MDEVNFNKEFKKSLRGKILMKNSAYYQKMLP